MRDSRAEAFDDAVEPLENMIEMLHLHGPRTVVPGLETMLDVCRVASTDPGAADEASRQLAATRRFISRPLSDVVINADSAAELTTRNERFEALKRQLFAALARTEPAPRIRR